ncbi:hypothetical protein [Methylobacterium platani]|uniref:Uncharacterized protein n=2 Tax=Methylobacterium platani TaxID=427683 RepID=A0A179SLY7_9HYPH|nr:hypothetical protein [Methylobacterium platani]KMO16516.1 hypothetical protein SQ03_14535 [Methylobacterium platani JCM 14648]OAS27454.1 hypothetical protein A5481_01445 [Methylobacterium platani]
MSDEPDDLSPIELPSGLLGEPARALPAFARLDGRIVVLIDAADYRVLLAARMQGTPAPRPRVRRAETRGLSTIERDGEVSDFLRERFRGRETIAALHTACVERFGRERAPSRGRIQVYRSRWMDHR